MLVNAGKVREEFNRVRQKVGISYQDISSITGINKANISLIMGENTVRIVNERFLRIYEAIGFDIMIVPVPANMRGKMSSYKFKEVKKNQGKRLEKAQGDLYKYYEKQAYRLMKIKEAQDGYQPQRLEETEEMVRLRQKYKGLKDTEQKFVAKNQPNNDVLDLYPIDMESDDGLTLEDFERIGFDF